MKHIINSYYLLRDARKNGYAVPAFNIHNLETIQVVLSVAKKMESPVILAGTPGTFSYGGVNEIVAIIESLAQGYQQQVVVHLDHHHDIEDINRKIQSGVRSAMIDGSALALQENIALTRRVTELCHAYNCSVEAEIGQLSGIEDDLMIEGENLHLTNPDEALRLVRETDIDSLAIAIGTAHGSYQAPPKLDFARLKKIADLTDIPLVLHGASGISDADIQHAISLGVTKVNVATDLKNAYSTALKDFFIKHPSSSDPREYNAVAKEKMADVVKMKIEACLSMGRNYHLN